MRAARAFIAAADAGDGSRPPEERARLHDRTGDLCAEAGLRHDAVRWYGRAIDAFLEGRYLHTAAAMCRKLIEYAPEVVRTRATLALLYVGNGCEAEARCEMNDIAAYLRAARRAGQEALAVRWFRVFAAAATSMELQALAAECLIELGDREAGAEILAAVECSRSEGRPLPVLGEDERWRLLLRTARLTPRELLAEPPHPFTAGAGTAAPPAAADAPVPRRRGDSARARGRDLLRATAGELELHYQPVVDVAVGRVAGVEALVRWRHPRHGLLLPSRFIPRAESTGAIVEIGAWVLREGCLQMREWTDRYGACAWLSVNLSGAQLHDPRLVPLIRETLARSRLPPELLILEITEGVMVAPDAATLDRLHAIQALGVRLAMDDFGSGHASFATLRRLPVSLLKLDRSLAPDTPRDRAVLDGIVAMAHTLELPVVAEGVETAAQLAHVRDAGCRWGQGFYFARPLTRETTAAVLYRTALGFGIESIRGFLHDGAGEDAGG